MRACIDAYVAGCPMHQMVKDCTQHPPGPLLPLKLPDTWFSDYIIDFIFGLPVLYRLNSIMTVVDRVTKRVVLIFVHESFAVLKAANL